VKKVNEHMCSLLKNWSNGNMPTKEVGLDLIK